MREAARADHYQRMPSDFRNCLGKRVEAVTGGSNRGARIKGLGEGLLTMRIAKGV